MDISRIQPDGQIKVPKHLLDQFELKAGDDIAFIKENGKLFITKASIVALKKLTKEISEEANRLGVSEEDLLSDIKKVREEMWHERNK